MLGAAAAPAAVLLPDPDLLFCCVALPQVWLAAQQPGIAGVVLHSPLLSGVRVFNPTLR